MYFIQAIPLFLALVLLLDLEKLNTRQIRSVLVAGVATGGVLSLLLLRFSIILLPGYILMITSLAVTVARDRQRRTKARTAVKKVIFRGLFSILFVGCLLLMYLFRQFDMPKPTGKYGIGTIAVEMTDKSRQETYTKDTDDYRKIMVQIWYPALKGKVKENDYMSYPSEVGKALQAVLKVPGGLFGYFSNIKMNTSCNAEVAGTNEKFPVVLYSPGNQSTRFQNMALIEEMASNGYIIVGIDHPYTSNDVVFTDGSIAVRSDGEESSLTDVAFYEYEIDIRTKDAIFALNEIENGNASAAVKNIKDRMDLEKIGFMGHSYGGATVAEALSRDRRIKAGVSFDGGLWGNAAEYGIQQPFLYMNASKTLAYLDDKSEKSKPYREFVLKVLNNLASANRKSSGDFYYLQMKNYNHYSFTDLPLISPLFSSGVQPVKTTIAYTLNFFDYYLKHKESMSLKEFSKQYNYVNFQQGSDIIFPR